MKHRNAPLIWDEAEALFEALDARVFDASEDEDFLDLPLEAAIARIRADLGLPADNDAAEMADVADAASPKVVIWRSSG